VWEKFFAQDWKVTFTPSQHWGTHVARSSSAARRILLEHQGRRIYHAATAAYFDGFKEIGRRLSPEIACCPSARITRNHPKCPHGADEAVKVFKDLGSQWLVPMHYGTFRLSLRTWTNRRVGCVTWPKRRVWLNASGFWKEGSPAVFLSGDRFERL